MERQQLTKERDKAYKESRGMLSLLGRLELRHNEAVTLRDCLDRVCISPPILRPLHETGVRFMCSLIHRFVNDAIQGYHRFHCACFSTYIRIPRPKHRIIQPTHGQLASNRCCVNELIDTWFRGLNIFASTQCRLVFIC